MKIRKRSLNIKRHTNGYLVGNSWRSRQETVKLAKQGKIDGVTVGSKDDIEFIRSVSGHTKLYDLPTVVKA